MISYSTAQKASGKPYDRDRVLKELIAKQQAQIAAGTLFSDPTGKACFVTPSEDYARELGWIK